MKSLILVLALLLASPSVFAQTFTVKRIKGKQAIIQLTSGTFYEGQSVSVDGDSSTGAGVGSGSAGTGPRNNFLGFSTGFSSFKSGGATATSLSLNVTYGWNKGTIEYGGLGSISILSGVGSNSTTIGIGGLFDYNFKPNRVGQDGIFAVGVNGRYGTSSGGTSSTVLQIFPAASYKWFILGTPTCLRFDAGLELTQAKTGSTNSSDTQPKVLGGLQTYF